MLRLQRSNLTIIGRRALQAAAGATNQLPAHRQLSNLRRKRIKENYQKYNDNIQKYNSPPLGMTDPFEYSGENVGEYSKKASLSPWTPLPDSVARRIFDIAQVQEDDIHVELGSGDGRVNFHAIEAGVGKSVGIDVDEDIVQVANDRLARIHPQPNISFLVSDLMDPDSDAWKYLDDATIITMFFATDGLERIKNTLETSLRGRRCKVFTCGYPMPTWESTVTETVLDIDIHFYDWGNEEVEDSLLTDRFVPEMPDTSLDSMGNMDKFLSKKKSTFRPDPLKGFHPDDLIDEIWEDVEEPRIDQEKED